GRGQPDRGRLLQAGVPRAADGVRGRGQEAAGSEPGRQRRMTTLRILALAAFALAAPAVAQAGEVECSRGDLEGVQAFRLPAHAELPAGGADVQIGRAHVW